MRLLRLVGCLVVLDQLSLLLLRYSHESFVPQTRLNANEALRELRYLVEGAVALLRDLTNLLLQLMDDHIAALRVGNLHLVGTLL